MTTEHDVLSPLTTRLLPTKLPSEYLKALGLLVVVIGKLEESLHKVCITLLESEEAQPSVNSHELGLECRLNLVIDLARRRRIALDQRLIRILQREVRAVATYQTRLTRWEHCQVKPGRKKLVKSNTKSKLKTQTNDILGMVKLIALINRGVTLLHWQIQRAARS